MPQRVGILGGAFDPPHQGHRVLAETALADLDLDLLQVTPTGQAWHKERALAPAVHRLEMTRLAFADLPRVQVDAREIQRQGPSYTVDTLTELRGEYPQAEFLLILGMDQAMALPTWHRWAEVAQLAIICVAIRADFSGAEGGFDALLARIPRVRRLNMPPVAISSTDIRHRLAQHQSAVPLVFEPVARYIAHHHLYQTT